MKELPAFVLLFLGMAVFGSGTPVSKLVTDSFDALPATFLRLLAASLALAPFLAWHRNDVKAFTPATWIQVGLIAAVGIIAFSLFMLHGMKQVSGVVGSIVMSATPAVTALAAVVFFHESFGWRKKLALALVVAGVLIVNLGSADQGGGNVLLGSLLVFGAVCSEAAYTLLGKKASEKANPILVAAVSSVLATLMILPLALPGLLAQDWQAIRPESWLALAWWGAGTMALGSVLWYGGVRRVQGGTAAGFMGVMPVSALVLSYALLGEPFRWMHLAGFLLVLCGVLLISWTHAKKGQHRRRHRNG